MNNRIRTTLIAVLCAFLAFVFWLGATVYAENIESDIATRTQLEIDKHRTTIPDISRVVDGREVTTNGTTSVEAARAAAGDGAQNVWGVRSLDNNIGLVPIPFKLVATHAAPNILITGQVDESAYNVVTNIHQALPPESTIDYQGLEDDGPKLLRSARIVETGIAAVTQLNPGTLIVTEKQFSLVGTVYSNDRKRTIEQLIDVRRAEIEPLEIIVDISVESPGITQACRGDLNQILANNVLNYAVDNYKILDRQLAVLGSVVDTTLGVCQGQIEKVLIEGHADYTGGAGYNQGLSERRSGTVRRYLVAQGVDQKLISSFGYGEFRPIASNETADGRALNRRTEIYFLTKDQTTGTTTPEISLIEE